MVALLQEFANDNCSSSSKNTVFHSCLQFLPVFDAPVLLSILHSISGDAEAPHSWPDFPTP